MKKTIEDNLWDILLTALLFISIGLAVHSCVQCNSRLKELQEKREYDIPNIRK